MTGGSVMEVGATVGRWECQGSGADRATTRFYGDAHLLFTHRCDKDVATPSPNSRDHR